MDWIVAHGGLVGLGILLAKYVLALFSVASVAVMFERAYNLRRVRRLEDAEYAKLRESLAKGQMDAFRSRVADGASPTAAAMAAGLSHPGAAPETVREAAMQEVVAQNAALTHNLPILATVAATAPYIGLFGTVLGILDAFDRIASSGQTGARVVAAPIAEALTATALGLGVAIPAVMAYNYFSGRVNDLSLRVETHTLDLTARLPADEKNGVANSVHPSSFIVQPSTGGEVVASR